MTRGVAASGKKRVLLLTEYFSQRVLSKQHFPPSFVPFYPQVLRSLYKEQGHESTRVAAQGLLLRNENVETPFMYGVDVRDCFITTCHHAGCIAFNVRLTLWLPSKRQTLFASIYRKLRARRALSIFEDVLSGTRRALSLYTKSMAI